jgi:hypothetical protein
MLRQSTFSGPFYPIFPLFEELIYTLRESPYFLTTTFFHNRIRIGSSSHHIRLRTHLLADLLHVAGIADFRHDVALAHLPGSPLGSQRVSTSTSTPDSIIDAVGSPISG